MTRTFDISTAKGIKAAERFKARMNDRFESVTVYSIGLTRVQIVALKPNRDELVRSLCNCGANKGLVYIHGQLCLSRNV